MRIHSITALALVVGTTLASGALAYEDAFGFQPTAKPGSAITLDLVRSTDAGTVEIRDFRAGTVGDVLGRATVHAGANDSVRVNLGGDVERDVLAVLLDADGNAVTRSVIEIENRD